MWVTRICAPVEAGATDFMDTPTEPACPCARLNMKNIPATPFVRRGDAARWLEELGIDERELDRMIDAGVLRRIVFRDGGHGYLLRSEICEKIIAPLEAAEAARRGGCAARIPTAKTASAGPEKPKTRQ